MKLTYKFKNRLKELNLIIKILLLVLGASLFFILFPFLLKYGPYIYIIFIVFLFIFGIVFRIVAGRKTFRITMWLWTSGSVIYLIIAFILIIKGIQPLPYIEMDRIGMILYYVSYPLRVLGIFFTGLIFSSITSPVEFLKWGEFGLKITLAYRAFEYSVNAFDANREALILQNQWPDFTKGERGFTRIVTVLKSAPILVSTTFRNLILWFPWAWICFNSLKKEIEKREEQ